MVNRTDLWVLVVVVVSFLVGAIGNPMLGEDTTLPLWIFTWIGIALIVVGAVLLIRSRRRA